MMRERGQGLVEMALVLPFLLILVIGLVEVSVVLNRQLIVVNAAREGARFAAFGAAPGDIYAQTLLATSGMVDFSEENAVIAVIYASTDDEGQIEQWAATVWPEGADIPHVTQAALLEQLSKEGDLSSVRLVIVDVRYQHTSLLGLPFVGALSEKIPIGSWTAMLLQSSEPASEAVCCAYPIALDVGSVQGLETGDQIEVRIGDGPGMFGWLYWDPNDQPSQDTLEANLGQPCLISERYLNACNPADNQLSVGDYVVGSTGETVSDGVRKRMDALKGNYIRIPLWSEFASCAAPCNCSHGYKLVHVAGFAIVDIVGVQLTTGDKTITARFIRMDAGCE
jgi:Flp pilus assembly protein TadG